MGPNQPCQSQQPLHKSQCHIYPEVPGEGGTGKGSSTMDPTHRVVSRIIEGKAGRRKENQPQVRQCLTWPSWMALTQQLSQELIPERDRSKIRPGGPPVSRESPVWCLPSGERSPGGDDFTGCLQDSSEPFQASLISMKGLVPTKTSEKEWKLMT